jgi:hypothetical protein
MGTGPAEWAPMPGQGPNERVNANNKGVDVEQRAVGARVP